MSGRRVVLCACCERPGEVEGRGLIRACYSRHQSAGTLGEFPARRELIREEYEPMHARGVSVREAARRIGVSERTIWRHKRALERSGVAS